MINSNQIIKWLILDRYIELESSLILNDGFSGSQSSVGLSGSLEQVKKCGDEDSGLAKEGQVTLSNSWELLLIPQVPNGSFINDLHTYFVASCFRTKTMNDRRCGGAPVVTHARRTPLIFQDQAKYQQLRFNCHPMKSGWCSIQIYREIESTLHREGTLLGEWIRFYL